MAGSNGTRTPARPAELGKAAVPVASEIGVTGLKQTGGVVQEEWLRALDSYSGVKTYSDMLLDPIVGAVMLAILIELRRVHRRLDPADDTPEAEEIAEWVDGCFDDMSHTFEDFMAEALTMLPYGWSYMETVYKPRRGEVPGKPGSSSKYADGRWGWRKIPIRAQDTLTRWEFDDEGGIAGMWQLADPRPETFIPIEKALLFRPSAHKGNPMGASILRSAYIPWYRRKHASDVEAIGIDRDMVGIPRFWLPADWMSGNATTEQAAAVAEYRRIGETIRVDEQACVIMPLAYDAQGHKLYDFDLVAAPGTKTLDVTGTITRLNQEIALTVLADVILIGHEGTGSFALSKEKYDAFTRGLESWLRAFASVVNRHAIPRLLQLNRLPMALAPELCFDPIERVDLDALGKFLASMSGAGAPLFPARDLEEHLYRVAGLPYTPPDERDEMIPEPPPEPVPPGLEQDPPARPGDGQGDKVDAERGPDAEGQDDTPAPADETVGSGT
jgi:hypothetical protein